ncbi:MAG: tryptophan-rich sensory protein [Bacteroidales bacterium]
MHLKIVNVAAFAIMVFMNYLANALPLGGKTTGELSAQYPNLFVPAGITFSIWGIIYLLLLGFCMLQFMAQNKAMVNAIGWLFALSCVLNSLWIVAWHNEKLILSMIVMLLLLATLIIINQRIASFAGSISKAAFGIYLGWICIATIANATALLVAVNWSGWGISDEVWTVIMVVAGAVITALIIKNYRNPFTGLAVIWALTGIMIARWPGNKPILIAAGASIAVIALITVIISFREQSA